MKRSIITAALVASSLTVAGGAAGVASADTPSVQFTGTVSEIVDKKADTGIPRRWMRHVGNPAPAGYSRGYQWGAPAITTPAGEVKFSGTLDLVDAVKGEFGLIGLFDTATLAAGERGHQEGSYIYASMLNDDTIRIGLSDGRAGNGEYVQTSHDINMAGTDRILNVEFIITPGGDTAACASGPADAADGCMTLAVDELDVLKDSYGTITEEASEDDTPPANGGIEFRDGGTPGWDGLASASAATGIDYDLTVSPVNVSEPQSKNDCRNGGWEAFGFEDQGQCVSSVARK